MAPDCLRLKDMRQKLQGAEAWQNGKTEHFWLVQNRTEKKRPHFPGGLQNFPKMFLKMFLLWFPAPKCRSFPTARKPKRKSMGSRDRRNYVAMNHGPKMSQGLVK